MEHKNVEAILGKKVVLVTGAGGSIGCALAQGLSLFEPRHLVLLDHSERNLHDVQTQITGNCLDTSFVLGSISDFDLLRGVFTKYRPQVVFHAAAYKHVPLMELNPLAAVANNGVATYGLASLCREYSVSNLILISTDKAVNPISIMGASKRIAELALNRLGDSDTHMTALRLGNVLSTEGSVVPLFLAQIRNGGPVTVTDKRAMRYFFTLEDAVNLILSAAAQDANDIFIPALKAPTNIHWLAMELIKQSNDDSHNKIDVDLTGLRPGDKLSEEFLYANETTTFTADPRLLRVVSHAGRVLSFDTEIEMLSLKVKERDVARTVEAVRRLVPEYQPSETLLRLSQEFSAQ